MQETEEMQVRPLDWGDTLEEGMATHSSVLAWRIPRTEKPGGATVHGVAKSQTQVKWLCTHSTANWQLTQNKTQLQVGNFFFFFTKCIHWTPPANRKIPKIGTLGHHCKIRRQRTKQSLKHGGKGERDVIFIFIYLAASDLSCGSYQQLNLHPLPWKVVS